MDTQHEEGELVATLPLELMMVALAAPSDNHDSAAFADKKAALTECEPATSQSTELALVLYDPHARASVAPAPSPSSPRSEALVVNVVAADAVPVVCLRLRQSLISSFRKLEADANKRATATATTTTNNSSSSSSNSTTTSSTAIALVAPQATDKVAASSERTAELERALLRAEQQQLEASRVLEHKTEQLAALQLANEQLDAKCSQLHERLEHAVRQQQHVQMLLDNFEASLRATKLNLSQVQKMVFQTQTNVTAAEACYAVASKQLDRLEDELVTLERAVATQTDHAHSLEQRLAAREIELAEAHSLLATTERKARNHLEALEAERERHALLELRNTELLEQLHEATKAARAIAEVGYQLHDVIRTSHDERSSVRAQLEREHVRCTELQSRAHELELQQHLHDLDDRHEHNEEESGTGERSLLLALAHERLAALEDALSSAAKREQQLEHTVNELRKQLQTPSQAPRTGPPSAAATTITTNTSASAPLAPPHRPWSALMLDDSDNDDDLLDEPRHTGAVSRTTIASTSVAADHIAEEDDEEEADAALSALARSLVHFDRGSVNKTRPATPRPLPGAARFRLAGSTANGAERPSPMQPSAGPSKRPRQRASSTTANAKRRCLDLSSPSFSSYDDDEQ